MPTEAASAGSITTSIADGVGRLSLNNPARKGAVTAEMAEGIREFCAHVDKDEEIGAVIIDSIGDYFCSGADTRALATASAAPASPESVAMISAVYDAFVAFGSLAVPTVSIVVGGAVGAGLNFAFAADVVLTTPDARFDSGFVHRQIHPGGGHFNLLGRQLNRQQAIAIGVLGQPITGSEAARLGAAWKAVARESIGDVALDLVRVAAADPALARRLKRSASMELGPNAVSWSAAVELERGVQMWSMARRGDVGWKAESPPPAGRTAPLRR